MGYNKSAFPFRSKQSNTSSRDTRGDLTSQNSAYLTQDRQINKSFKPTLSKELQEDIDYIKNDKDLSYSQKVKQATDLLMNRSGEWQRTPDNKTNLNATSLMYGVGGLAANIAPFIAAEMVTGGGATPSAVRKFTTLFTSAVATTFHDEYLAKLKEGSANPFRDATVSTAINAAALTGADTPALIKKWAAGQKTAIGSLISKLTDKEIQVALSETPKALSKFKRGLDGVKNIATGTAKAGAEAFKGGAKVSAFTTGGQIVNDAISGNLKSPEDYAKQAAIETLKFTILGTGMGAYGKIKDKPSDLALSMSDEVARNPQAFRSSLAIMESDGAITPKEAAQVKNNIDKIEQVYKSSPILKNEALTDDAKREYLYNSLVKQESKDASNGLPPQQKEKLDYQAQVADFKNNLLVSPPTDKQLQSRKEQLEKQLIPEEKEDGTKVLINEKLKKDTEAELEAVTHAIEQREAHDVADKNAKRLLRNTDDAATTADANAKRLLEERKGTEGIEPIQENVTVPKEQGSETNVPESTTVTGQGNAGINAPVLGHKIQWDVYGNEGMEHWAVGEKTKTRGGQDAVILSKTYVESSKDGKTYSKEYADANGIKYDNEHTVEHTVPLSELNKTGQGESTTTTPDGGFKVGKIDKPSILINETAADAWLKGNLVNEVGDKRLKRLSELEDVVNNSNSSEKDKELSLNAIKRERERLATTPVLKNIKDFANENDFYRVVVGDKAFEDIVKTGKVRTGGKEFKKNPLPGTNLTLTGRPTRFPSFSKGKANEGYAYENPNHYIIESSDPNIQPSTLGRHGKGSTMFPTDGKGNYLDNYDAKNVRVYKHLGDGKYELVYDKGKEINKKVENKVDQIKKAIDGADELKSKIYQNIFKSGDREAIKDALKDVSDQWHDEGTREATERNFGKNVVDAAKELFPQESIKSLTIEENNATEVPNTTESKSNSNEKVDSPSSETEGGEKETIVSHAGMQDLADDFGLGAVEVRNPVSDKQDKKSAEETATKWNEEGTYAKNIDKLLKNIEDGHGSNPTEKHILQQHIANVRAEATRMDIHDPKYDTKIAELERLKTAGATLKSTAGATLRTSTLGSVENPTMADWMAERQTVTGEPLTEKQKEETASMFKEYEDKVKAAEEKQAQAEKEVADLKAELALKPERDRARTIRKKNREALSKERGEIISSIGDKLKKLRGESNATIVPYAKELFAIAPDVAKLVRNLAETGTSKLADVVDAVHDILKGSINGITKKDVTDIIAGEYNEKKKPLSELQKTLKDLKEEARLTNKLEALENGEPVPERKKEARSKEIEDLRKQIKDLQDKIKQDQKEPTDTKEPKSEEDKSLESAKKRLETQIKKIEEDIKNKNFEEKKKGVPLSENDLLKKANPELWKATMDAQIARDNIKHDFEILKLKDEYEKRNFFQKASGLGEKVFGTVKAIVTGVDDSGVGVQGIMALISRPITGGRALKEHALDAFSKTRFNRNMAALESDPYYSLAKKSKLSITDPKSLKDAEKEEIFSDRFHGTIKVKGKEIKLLDKFLEPFERAFTSLGNNLRFLAFKEIAAKQMAEGHTFENNPKLFESIAGMLNTETGRGKQNEYIEKASKLVTKGIWSPKLLASKLNALGISDIASLGLSKAGTKGYYRQMSPEVRKMAIKDLTAFATTTVALTYLSALSFGGKIDWDILSSTFMDVKFPNGRSYNFSGGFSSVMRFIAQEVRGGKRRDGVFRKDGHLKMAGRYFRGKTPPITSALVNTWEGEDFMGKPTGAVDQAKQILIPIAVKGIIEEMQKDGSDKLLNSAVNFVGFNVKDEADFNKKDDLETLLTRNDVPESQHQEKIVNNKDKGRPITDEEFKKYSDVRSKKVKEDITKLYNNGYPIKRGTEVKVIPYKEMTKDEIIYATTDIKKNATDEAKEELFGKHKKTSEERRADRKLRKLKSSY